MQLFSRAPTSHYVVVRQLESRYDALIASGQAQPFVYPFVSAGALVGIVYLCIDHRNRPILRQCRFLVWGLIAAFSTYCVGTMRARNPAAAFGVGLVSSWATLWCAMVLVFTDAQADFRRIERKEVQNYGKAISGKQNGADGHVSRPQSLVNGNGELRHRKSTTSSDEPSSPQSPSEETGTLIWQTYPSGSLYQRVDWICDLFSSFRGMGWSYRISGLPPPPTSVQEELSPISTTSNSQNPTQTSRTGIRRYRTRRELLRYNTFLLVRNYIFLDLIKTLIVNDPYFWTGDHTHKPSYIPPFSLFSTSSPVLTKSIRLAISLAAIYYALETIFALGPLFFSGILGPKILGVRGEPWLYTDQFGSFSNVLNKGLAGWWGGFWHQTFRFGFEAPSSALVELLGWDKRGQKAKSLTLCVAFTLSGCLHACGSFTQIGDTRPIRGPFCFFVLQILGISAQMAGVAVLKKMGIRDKCPAWLGKVVNFVYVHVWMYHTAPLLVDDFASGGVWLFEPLPISVFRGLGLGAKEDGWFPLLSGNTGGDIARWHTGDKWWKSGIAL